MFNLHCINPIKILIFNNQICKWKRTKSEKNHPRPSTNFHAKHLTFLRITLLSYKNTFITHSIFISKSNSKTLQTILHHRRYEIKDCRKWNQYKIKLGQNLEQFTLINSFVLEIYLVSPARIRKKRHSNSNSNTFPGSCSYDFNVFPLTL